MRAAPLDEYMKLTAVCEYVVTCISVLVLVAAVSEYVRLRQAAAAGVTRPASLASHGRRAERRADAAPGGGVAEVQSADQPAAVAATRHRAVREEVGGGESGRRDVTELFERRSEEASPIWHVHCTYMYKHN